MIPGLALDIDETLSDTNIFWFTKLSELFGNPESLSPREIATKYRYSQQVPYWQTPEALTWMEEARHGNELQVELPLIEDAKHNVARINTIVPIVAYVTARPEVVREGTLRWLATHGFPEAPLIMKPLDVQTEAGVAWKAQLLAERYPDILGIVDDHPGLMDALPADYQGTVFLYNYEGPVRTNLHIVACPTWEAVYTAVVKNV
jgi:hypothetical protein